MKIRSAIAFLTICLAAKAGADPMDLADFAAGGVLSAWPATCALNPPSTKPGLKIAVAGATSSASYEAYGALDLAPTEITISKGHMPWSNADHGYHTTFVFGNTPHELKSAISPIVPYYDEFRKVSMGLGVAVPWTIPEGAVLFDITSERWELRSGQKSLCLYLDTLRKQK